MNEQINEQLVLLQDELSRLKKVTDYIDNAKTNATVIITELEQIQKNYAQYTDELYNLYKQGLSDLKKEIESQIANDVQRLEDTGNRIHQTNEEQLADTKTLLEQYTDVTEASHSLINTLKEIDFHQKLDAVASGTEQLLTSGNDFRLVIEQKIDETHLFVTEKSKELKSDIDTLIVSEFKKCKSLIQEHTEQNFEWQARQEKEINTLKMFTLIVGGLVILSMILLMMK